MSLLLFSLSLSAPVDTCCTASYDGCDATSCTLTASCSAGSSAATVYATCSEGSTYDDFVTSCSVTGPLTTDTEKSCNAPNDWATTTCRNIACECAPPTPAPTLAPTFAPTLAPTLAPTFAPTLAPTVAPTVAPTLAPTVAPTLAPTLAPTIAPTLAPTVAPTLAPTLAPTVAPTLAPTLAPTVAPTLAPTVAPTLAPTLAPTVAPTLAPTLAPTVAPTLAPTVAPTLAPTLAPTVAPTLAPTLAPTIAPTLAPTLAPTIAPTASPTIVTPAPTLAPTIAPTAAPTLSPTIAPTPSPTLPTPAPTLAPTIAPTPSPTSLFTPGPTPSPTPAQCEAVTISDEVLGNLVTGDYIPSDCCSTGSSASGACVMDAAGSDASGTTQHDEVFRYLFNDIPLECTYEREPRCVCVTETSSGIFSGSSTSAVKMGQVIPEPGVVAEGMWRADVVRPANFFGGSYKPAMLGTVTVSQSSEAVANNAVRIETGVSGVIVDTSDDDDSLDTGDVWAIVQADVDEYVFLAWYNPEFFDDDDALVTIAGVDQTVCGSSSAGISIDFSVNMIRRRETKVGIAMEFFTSEGAADDRAAAFDNDPTAVGEEWFDDDDSVDNF